MKSGRLICTKVVSLPVCGIGGDDDDKNKNRSYFRFYYYNATITMMKRIKSSYIIFI